MNRSDFRDLHALRVRWGECDPQGVVFNPNYLMYADVAGTEHMRGMGVLHLGGEMFVVNANLNFRASARFDDLLQIGARVESIGRSSMVMLVAIWREDVLLADVRATYVRVDPATGRPTPLWPEMIAAIEAYERTAPERR